MKTLQDLERAAYIAGNTALANAYDACATLERAQDDCELDFNLPIGEQIEAMQEKAVADNAPDYEAYKQFFEECFARLDGHYPSPSVTSAHDCSVIFDAIARGEGTTE
jgi:hypothetical protein